MSGVTARRLLLERLGSSQVALMAVLLDLETMPAWCDGRLDDGRSVVLVGRHALGDSEDARALIALVLEELANGTEPPGIHVVSYLPMASRAIAEVVDPAVCWSDEPGGVVDGRHIHEEVCWPGGRASGKTQGVGGALAILGERHARAESGGILRCLWLHASLRDAAMKTGRSLTEPMWGSRWRLEGGETSAIFTVGGHDLVAADFVGVRDQEAQERARASAHVIACEEPIPSLAEHGVALDRYSLALTSTRRGMATPRRVSIVTTNPGSESSWPYQRFMALGHPQWCTSVKVSNRERCTPEQLEALAADLASTPALRARLIGEEWVDLPRGPLVCPDFDPVRHVAKEPLWLVPQSDLVLGWDSGVATNVSACAILQRNGPRINCFATLVIENLGLRRLITDRVVPWLQTRAPWVLSKDGARTWLRHAMDPSMRRSPENQGRELDENPERLLHVLLGGKTYPGAVAWQPRIAPLLFTLAPDSDCPLRFDPSPDTEWGRRALAGQWHYDLEPGTADDPRDAPAKKERVFADTGEAIAYAIALLAPSQPSRGGRRKRYPTRYSIPDPRR